MYPATTWHADGLRWIAAILTQAADALERPEAEAMQPPSAGAACDEARSRGDYRAPYY